MNEVIAYIQELKAEIERDIQTDHEIGCDPYENIARLKVCERIEKIVKKMKGAE